MCHDRKTSRLIASLRILINRQNGHFLFASLHQKPRLHAGTFQMISSLVCSLARDRFYKTQPNFAATSIDLPLTFNDVHLFALLQLSCLPTTNSGLPNCTLRFVKKNLFDRSNVEISFVSSGYPAYYVDGKSNGKKMGGKILGGILKFGLEFLLDGLLGGGIDLF